MNKEENMSVRHACLQALVLMLAGSFVGAQPLAGASPSLSAEPEFLFFRQTGTATLPSAQIQVSATGGVSLGAFTATAATASGGNWLSVSPTAGTGPTTLTVSVNTTGLAAGEYAGSVTIAAAIAATPAVTGVLLEVSGSGQASLVLRPSHLEFDAVAGGSAPPAQTVMIISATAQNWTAAASVTTPAGGTWLKLSATSGTSTDTLKVMADPTGLAAESYTGTVTVTEGSMKASVSVTFNVAASEPPALELNPPVITFTPDNDCEPPKACPVFANGFQRTLNITNSGSGAITWTAKVSVDSPASGSWLSMSASSGTTPSQVTVMANSTGLGQGVYSGEITVTGGGSTTVERVFLVVNGAQQPRVHVYPKALEFHFGEGVLTPASRQVFITSNASGLSYTATASTAMGGNWLSISPSSGTITTTSFLTASVSATVAATWRLGCTQAKSRFKRLEHPKQRTTCSWH